MKLSAVEAIRKYYYEKGYRNVQIDMYEQSVSGVSNGVVLNFVIDKGSKVRINSINFTGNETVGDQKLKKQMKGTKEMKLCMAYKVISPYGDSIVTFVAGDKSELKPGAKIIIFGAVKKDDGTLEANRVNVGRDGITPPM